MPQVSQRKAQGALSCFKSNDWGSEWERLSCGHRIDDRGQQWQQTIACPRTDVWVQDLEGGEAIQVTSQGGDYALESWDGKYLYYTRGRGFDHPWWEKETANLMRIPVDGGKEVEILPGGLEDWTVWDLAPTGIYYSSKAWVRSPAATPGYSESQEYRIHYMNLVTGEITEIFRDESPFEHLFLAVSPDEQWILFSRVRMTESDLMLVENFR